MREKFPQVIETAQVIGDEYIVNPAIDDSRWRQTGSWHRAAETFNRIGELSKRACIQFAYHNHWWEFQPIDGKLSYDILLENTDLNLVKMEMDLCWITAAGQDPVEYFRRYPVKFPLVHVKDNKKVPFVPPSDPKMNISIGSHRTWQGQSIRVIFAESNGAGIKHYFEEQDFARAPLESIQASYGYFEQLEADSLMCE